MITITHSYSLRSSLILFVACGLWLLPWVGRADDCEKIEIKITNHSKYDWYLDENHSDDPHSLPSKISAGTSVSFQQQSGIDYYSGGQYEQNMTYYVKAHAKQTGSDSDDNRFLVKFYVSYDKCNYTKNCDNVDAKANITEDPSHIASADSDDGKSECAQFSWPDIVHYSDPEKGSATFTIGKPTAVAIKIKLPKQDKNIIFDRTFLQETYNWLRPDLLAKFDSTLSNPIEEQDNSLNFSYVCTSDDCRKL